MNTTIDLEDGTYKSKLIIRSYNNIGLCTGWDDINNYIDLNIDIIGSLYTKLGAEIIIRNLLRNPQIKLLIIVDTNPLGQNEIGNKGLKLLYDIFINKIYDGLTYKQTELKELDETISIYYIHNDKIVSNNKLDPVGKINKNDIKKYINELINNNKTVPTNRSKHIYIPDKIEELKYIPNEYIGQKISGNSLFDSWFQTLAHIYKYGNNNNDLREYHSIHWNYPINNINNSINKYREIITQSDVQQMIGLNNKMLSDYSKLINENIIIPTSAYTYGNRLEVYKNRIIKNLQDDKSTRYAFGTTLKYDIEDKQAPCLVYVQLLFDTMHNKLNLYAVFRSHDIFKAAFVNGYGLADMLLKYSKLINTEPGLIEITSISGHIYLTDLHNTKLFLDCMGNEMKKIEHYDPRCNCIITKQNNDQFICEIRDPDTNKLMITLSGTNKKIYHQILTERIIESTEHLKYIFEQLF